ncbi:MAG: glycoside hydrolase domain-containing protein, partial [Anaerolineales bacterium]
AQRWLLMVPGQAQLVRTLDRGATTATIPQDQPAAGVMELDMVTPEHGWAQYASGQCTTVAAPPGLAANLPQRHCAMEVRLMRTADGGRTWQVLSLPSPDSPPSPSAPAETYTGQGFDSCTKPPLHQMLTWSVDSPYRAWNLYIGGSSRANCGTLTESFIESLAGQGWKLIPTWVGPQAACSSFRSRMSYDPATAYQEGVVEANAAFSTATALGLTPPDTAGAIIYYDLEAYSVSNSACREAARAFISGWTSQLHALGSQAGVYGSTCGSALSDFVTNAHVPEAIWAAVWLVPYQYRPDASVWNLPCLDNSLWSASQRLRQYSGGHNENWGGVTLNIDSNVLNGIIAVVSNPCPQADGVTLYWHSHYACTNSAGDLGYRQRTTTGWQDVHDGSFNDNASSLRVPAGWSVRLFEHTERGGASVCYRTDIADFSTQGNFPGTGVPINDNVSSIEVFDNGNCASDWQETFFADTDLGTACGTRTESGVYLFRDSLAGWSLPAGCPGVEEAWSVRMVRHDAWFDGGTYEFGLFYDDAARLYVDGALVVDGWSDSQHYGSRALSAGSHQLILEYKNNGGRAIAQLWWRGPGAVPASQTQDASQWWVSYWGNQSQFGDPVTSQNEGAGFLARNWGNGGPGFEIPDDHFSTRFERTINFGCGTYAFHLRSDDGSRLAIDGVNQAQFDHWSPGIWETRANVTLAAGNHVVTIDQHENAGAASLHFNWTLVAPCAATRLYLPLIANP